MNVTQDALWLIGIGSVLVALAETAGSERPRGGSVFSGPFTSLRERRYFAVRATGLASIAVGGVLVMGAGFADWWFVPVSIGALFLSTYLLAAWKLHQYRLFRMAQIEDKSGDPWQFAYSR
jgi:hypothetical protein